MLACLPAAGPAAHHLWPGGRLCDWHRPAVPLCRHSRLSQPVHAPARCPARMLCWHTGSSNSRAPRALSPNKPTKNPSIRCSPHGSGSGWPTRAGAAPATSHQSPDSLPPDSLQCVTTMHPHAPCTSRRHRPPRPNSPREPISFLFALFICTLPLAHLPACTLATIHTPLVCYPLLVRFSHITPHLPLPLIH